MVRNGWQAGVRRIGSVVKPNARCTFVEIIARRRTAYNRTEEGDSRPVKDSEMAHLEQAAFPQLAEAELRASEQNVSHLRDTSLKRKRSKRLCGSFACASGLCRLALLLAGVKAQKKGIWNSTIKVPDPFLSCFRFAAIGYLSGLAIRSVRIG